MRITLSLIMESARLWRSSSEMVLGFPLPNLPKIDAAFDVFDSGSEILKVVFMELRVIPNQERLQD